MGWSTCSDRGYTTGMNLTLDARHEEIIRRKVDLGEFAGPNEALAHAVDLLDEEEVWSEQDKIEFTARLEEGSAQIARGEGISSAEFEAQVEAWLARPR